MNGKVSSFIIIAMILFSVRIVIGGRIAPDFTLTDIDGIEFSLSSYRGKVILLDLFSTLCGPCIAEFPHLKALREEFGEDLVIISISVRAHDTVEKLQQFRQEHEMDWIVASDTVGVRGALGGLWSIPTLVIIDQERYIRYIHEGLTGASILADEIRYIIARALVGDFNGDAEVDIIDISTVAKSFGAHSSDEMWNEAVDLNDDEVINILDVATVAVEYGKIQTPFNYVLNPSVEIGETGDSSPEYWQKRDYGDVGAVHTWLNTGHMGSHAVKISVKYNTSAPGWHSAQWYQFFRIQYSPFDIGSRSLFRFWYQSSIKCYIYAGFRDGNGQWIGGQSAGCEAASTWTLSQWLEFTVPEGTHRIEVGIFIRNEDAQQETDAYAFADDFELILE